MRTYGPTAVTALVALVHAQYALFIDSEHTGEHQDRAIALEQRITERAGGSRRRGVRFADEADRVVDAIETMRGPSLCHDIVHRGSMHDGATAPRRRRIAGRSPANLSRAGIRGPAR